MEPDLGEGYHEAPSQGDGWRWVGDGHLASGTLLDAGMCLLPHTQHRSQRQQRLGRSYGPLDISKKPKS